MQNDFPAFIETLDGVPVECIPLARQPYINCYIEAGITDHPVDQIFLRFSREKEESSTFFLRPDEAAAICYVLGGTLFSYLVEKVITQ